MPSPLSLSSLLYSLPSAALSSSAAQPEHTHAAPTAPQPIFDEAIAAVSPDTRPPARRRSHASRRVRQMLGTAHQVTSHEAAPATSLSTTQLAVPPATQGSAQSAAYLTAQAITQPVQHQAPAAIESPSSDENQSADQRERKFFPMYMPPYVRRRLPDPSAPGVQLAKAERANAVFFSRYEPPFRYDVSLLGGAHELRAAMARVGLRTGGDIQITHQRVSDTTIAVAQFRHWRDAVKLGRLVLPSRVAVNASERLQADAQLEATRVALPRRPTLPTLAPDAAPSTIIKKVLDFSEGMVVGEAHQAISSKRFLIDQMQTFRAQGVQTIFMEHLLSDEHQADLDLWHRCAPGFSMPPAVARYLSDLNVGHMDEHFIDQAQRRRYRQLRERYNFANVAVAAQCAGIKIVAIDCKASYEVHSGGLSGNTTSSRMRTEMMNYFASEKIRRRSLPGKWVALVGNSHANTYNDVPGVAEQTGTLAVVVNDKIQTPSAPGVRTRVTNFVPGLKLDIVVTMDWN